MNSLDLYHLTITSLSLSGNTAPSLDALDVHAPQVALQQQWFNGAFFVHQFMYKKCTIEPFFM